MDLAIASKADILTPLQIALEDSRLPYTFDLEDGIERLIRAYQMSDVSWLADLLLERARTLWAISSALFLARGSFAI